MGTTIISKNGHWRCKCGSLLGVEEHGIMHVHYKELRVAAASQVSVHCRKCSRVSVWTAPSEHAEAA